MSAEILEDGSVNLSKMAYLNIIVEKEDIFRSGNVTQEWAYSTGDQSCS